MVKKKDNNLIIALGVVLAIVLFSQTTFFGALVTTCTSSEPASYTAFETYITDQNWTLNTLSEDIIIALPGDNVSTTIIKKEVIAGFGTFNMGFIGFNSCDTVLNELDANLTNSTIISLNNTKVLDNNNLSLFWCSDSDTTLLEVDNKASFDLYYNNFISCVTVDVPGNTTNETNTTNTTTTNETANVNIGDGGVSETGNEGILDKLSDKLNIPREKTPFVIVGMMIILFGAYWFLEKGDSKGFIKKKNKRRRR